MLRTTKIKYAIENLRLVSKNNIVNRVSSGRQVSRKKSQVDSQANSFKS